MVKSKINKLGKNVLKRANKIEVSKPNKDSISLWDEIDRLRAQVPPEEWDKLPTDLAKNVDHYLYGHKKID